MFKIIKLLFLILVFVFEKSSAIHHHKRISENFLIGTPYLWKNRLLLMNGDEEHRCTNQTDKELRVNININYK